MIDCQKVKVFRAASKGLPLKTLPFTSHFGKSFVLKQTKKYYQKLIIQTKIKLLIFFKRKKYIGKNGKMFNFATVCSPQDSLGIISRL